MVRLTTLAAAPALVLFMGSTAHAALTADQVWQSWKDGAALAGLAVNAATESNAGGVLTLNGVTVAPEGAGDPLTISDMTLAEQSDGSVLITPGAAIGLTSGTPEAGGNLKVTHEGLTLTAREGEAGGIVYDFAAAKLAIDADGASEGTSLSDAPAKPATFAAGFTFEGLAGSYSDTPGTNRAFGLDLTATKLVYDIANDDPNLPMKTASTSETADVAFGLDVTLPSAISLAGISGAADFGTALQEGFALAATMKQGASAGTASQEDAFFPYQMTMTSGGGDASFRLDKDVFSLVSGGSAAELDITSASIPAPVRITIAEMAINMVSPMMAGEVAGDYALMVKLGQLAVNDEVWGMFDPGAALKREPLDLVIDLSGKAKIDWLAIAAAEDAGTPPPVPAPETLDIKDITLKVAGAAANAVGAFTFDNSMGMPMPLGSADVTVTGANALIDGLIATGLIGENEAMSARMMMGAFMVPGAEPDSLTSKIEAKEGFQIFVNGQQIQ